MDNLEFSELRIIDIDENYIEILSQLSPHRKNFISVENAKKAHIKNISNNRKNYKLTKDEKIIGVGSIIFDYRILNFSNPSAHVEDIAIRKDLHGFGYGKILMDHIKETARAKNAYKIILSCADYNIKFYKKCGFIQSCATMRFDFDEDYPVEIEEIQ